MLYLKREDVLKIFEEEPLVWDNSDPAQVQEHNDWEYYKDLIEALPTVESENDNDERVEQKTDDSIEYLDDDLTLLCF